MREPREPQAAPESSPKARRSCQGRGHLAEARRPRTFQRDDKSARPPHHLREIRPADWGRRTTRGQSRPQTRRPPAPASNRDRHRPPRASPDELEPLPHWERATSASGNALCHRRPGSSAPRVFACRPPAQSALARAGRSHLDPRARTQRALKRHRHLLHGTATLKPGRLSQAHPDRPQATRPRLAQGTRTQTSDAGIKAPAPPLKRSAGHQAGAAMPHTPRLSKAYLRRRPSRPAARRTGSVELPMRQRATTPEGAEHAAHVLRL
jgi:hypothetical protein